MPKYVGTDGNDTLTGSDGDDSLYPNLGVDQVNGEQGFDTLFVDYSKQSSGSTANVITDEGGDQFGGLLASGADSTTLYNVESIIFHAGQGDDTLNLDATPIGHGAKVALDGGGGTNSLQLQLGGFESAEFIVKPDGKITSNLGHFENWTNYNIELGGGTNKVVTQSGVDFIQGHGGIDLISTGGGDDTMLFDNATGTFDGGDGTDSWSDTFASSAANLTFRDATDHISNGTTFKNIENYGITAGSGDDTFDISTAQEGTVVGGTGYDTLNVDATANDIGSYSGIGLGDDGLSGYLDTGGRFSFYQMENLNFHAGSSFDYISVTENATSHPATLHIDGGGGYNVLTLDVSALGDGTTFIDGGDGTVSSNRGGFADFTAYDITAGAGDDRIVTGAGNDRITDKGGTDIAGGGAGDDVITFVGATGHADGGDGIDSWVGDYSGTSTPLGFEENGTTGKLSNGTLIRNFESVSLTAGSGDDRILLSSSGNATVHGGAGDDLIQSGPGDDVLDGGAGHDVVSYDGATAGVTVNLGITSSQNTIGAGYDTLSGFEAVHGSQYGDTLTADDLGDALYGLAGDDVLVGGGGDDILIGGTGQDMMTGGGGADRFIFSSLGDFSTGTLDLIKDFSHAQGDRIDLSKIDPDAAAAGDQSFTFIGTAGFTGAGGSAYELRDQHNADGSYTVSGDVNHDGVADFSFTVMSPTALVASDFIL